MALVETYYPYNCFVDESIQERHGIKATGVSAYLAPFERWMKFEEEWHGILRHFKVPPDGKDGHNQPFMHMTDFLARKEQFRNDWGVEKRNDFMERVTMTISEHTVVGVSVSVIDSQFERILPSDAQGFWREPYFFCLWGVLTTLMGMEEHYEGMVLPSPFWFLFDPKPKAQRFAGALFSAVKVLNKTPEKFGQMGFGEMWRTPEIQAADILAYESVRRRCDREQNPKSAIRKSLQTLVRKQRVLLIEMEEANLARYVEFVRRKPEIGNGH